MGLKELFNAIYNDDDGDDDQGKVDKRWTAKHTGVSEKHVNGAWHNAREACENDNDPYSKNLRKDWKRGSKGYVYNDED